MDAGTLDLETIFGQDRSHVVPLSRRAYACELKKQWSPLWDDIVAVAHRLPADLVNSDPDLIHAGSLRQFHLPD